MEEGVKSSKKGRNFTTGGIILIVLFFAGIWMKSPSEQFQDIAKDPESLDVTWITNDQQGWTGGGYHDAYKEREEVCYLEISSHTVHGKNLKSLPDSLANFTRLHTLNLFEINVSEKEISRIQSLLPQVQIIYEPSMQARQNASNSC